MGGTRNYGAKGGQQIAGNLYRGAGGKFTRGSGGGGAQAKPNGQQQPAPEGEAKFVIEKGKITGKYMALLEKLANKEKLDEDTMRRFKALGLAGTKGLTVMGRALVKAKQEGNAEELTRLTNLVIERWNSKNKRRATRSGNRRQNTDRQVAQGSKPQESVVEADTKTVSGRTYQRSDFLVVEDPEKPSTWHLPVKVGGKPDHRLMGAAWAALHKGYRGNRYEGPKKGEALSKLKSLYKDEGMETPVEEAAISESDLDTAADDEPIEEYGDLYYRPYGGAKTFADLEAARKANEAAARIETLSYQFPSLVLNIVCDPMESNKASAVRKLTEEFTILVDEALADVTAREDAGDDQPPASGSGESLAESFVSQAVGFEEVDQPETTTVKVGEESKPTFAYLDIQPIRPGWGNERDNHYYPADVLERDRVKFVGAKMYESDHNATLKSTRTWVSTIIEDQGMSKAGAPVARVAIHDPIFAEKVRNLNKLGLLEKLECSIMAAGTAEPGFALEGRAGKRVTAITEVYDVDWVTRAGAGGKALALVENAEGALDMTENTNKPEGDKPEDQTIKPNENGTQPTLIREGESETKPEGGVAEQPKALTVERVSEVLGVSKLPKLSQDRLAEGIYLSEDVLSAAVAKETEYVKALTGSGKPTGLGESGAESGAADQLSADKLAEAAAAKSKVNQKFVGALN